MCTYCYITAYIPRAFSCRVKRGFLRSLWRDLKHANREMHISIANSSDPYTPLEREYRLTREALKMIVNAGFKFQIITKSPLVVRDINILKRGKCTVSMTITTPKDPLAKKLEPNAPVPSLRIEAIKLLSKEGIPCSVRIDPIIPAINDDFNSLQELIRMLGEAGVKHVTSSTYKAKKDNFKRLTAAFPEHKNFLYELYWLKGEAVGRAKYLEKRLRWHILKEVKYLVEREGMTFATCREGFPQLKSSKTCDGSHLIDG